MPWINAFDWGVLLLSVLLIQGWSRDPGIRFSGNPAAWTLTVEALFYALHPLLIRGVVRLRQRGAVIASVVVVSIAMMLKLVEVLSPGAISAVWGGPIAYLPSFIVGMFVGWAMRVGWRPHIPLLIPTLLLSLMLVVSSHAASWGPVASAVRVFTPELIVALCALLIIAAASLDL